MLACNVLPGIVAKRLWKFKDEVIIPGMEMEVTNRGRLLTIDNIPVQQSGQYSCMAIANFGEDSIDYVVKVNPVRSLIVISDCNDSSSIWILSIKQTDNSIVLIRWDDSTRFNMSCYESLRLAWWTNASMSEYREKKLALSAKSAVISVCRGLRHRLLRSSESHH